MTGDDVALAALYVRVDELTELLQDVCDVLPHHLEQQEQALLDGIAGAAAALRWVRNEGVRAAGMERWLQLLEDASTGAALESPSPTARAAGGLAAAEIIAGAQAQPVAVLATPGDRQIVQLAGWLRREQESRARERARLYDVIAHLHSALHDAHVRAAGSGR